jgi:DNA-binding PadR family transcriptional regulator
MSEVLGPFEQAVMLAIIRLADRAYGRAILNEAQARLQRDVAAGAVYATLDRLEQKGLISSHLGSGTPIRAGRPRRYYIVDDAGVSALNDTKAAMQSMWRGFRVPLKSRA